MIEREVGPKGRHRAPRSSKEMAGYCDLTRCECVAAVLRKAFPLPTSGAFTDLLAAIDDSLWS